MSPDDITAFLDNAIRSRIVVRLIAEQHIAISQALRSHHPTDVLGVVDTRCSPAEMVTTCSSFVAEMCDATVGASPACVLEGDVGATFASVSLIAHSILLDSHLLQLCSRRARRLLPTARISTCWAVHMEYILTELLKSTSARMLRNRTTH